MDVAESVSLKGNGKAGEALIRQLTSAVQSVSSTIHAANIAASVVLG